MSVLINIGSVIINNDTILPIVQDGLVLNLDAQNIFSYPRVGNTWYDLGIELTHTSLIGGSSFNFSNGGYISFDGTNDYATATTLSNSLLNVGSGGIVSVECFFRLVSLPQSFHPLFLYGGTGLSNAAYGISIGTTGALAFFAGGDTNVALNNNIQTGTWGQIVCIFRQTGNALLYINGILATNTFLLNQPPDNKVNDLLKICGDGTSLYTNADIGLVRVYNRELTANEVSQNFNASRWRFGI